MADDMSPLIFTVISIRVSRRYSGRQPHVAVFDTESVNAWMNASLCTSGLVFHNNKLTNLSLKNNNIDIKGIKP